MKYITIVYICLGIGLILFGSALTLLYQDFHPEIFEDCSTQVKIQGIWLPDIQRLSEYHGRYICINIDETKSLKELKETCQHEIGHEIFARSCEDNFDNCLKVEDE